jgi:hypothetical protein
MPDGRPPDRAEPPTPAGRAGLAAGLGRTVRTRLASQPLASLGDAARGRRRTLAVPASPPGQRLGEPDGDLLVVVVANSASAIVNTMTWGACHRTASPACPRQTGTNDTPTSKIN